MAYDYTLAAELWNRYQYARDNGHLDFVNKAARCEDFFAGMQWNKEDLALLRASRRPALTINKIISTLSNVMGEQIYNRTEIAFKPRNAEANAAIADVLTKVFMQISDNNQLPWVRSDVFADGIVTSRGFYDARLDFSDSLRGEVRVEQLNPKNVLIDPDAEEYDPDKWGDVIVSKWLSPDDIALLYSAMAAKELKGKDTSGYTFGYDSFDINRDRFGAPRSYGQNDDATNLHRCIRVLERQWRKLDNVQHFVSIQTGDMRVIPVDWDYNKISEYLQQNPDLAVTKKLVKRIRWTVCADNYVLHDDWSPYSHFSVVPFFPYFRRGRTIGLVENLLGPQELLNKVSSQELHVVNTTANSGWKIKTGALRNMSTAELEQRGAQTGLVMELDDISNAEKIDPNQTPTGLDRISYKAEEHIKTISGVNDYRSGNPREDVSAKAVKYNQQASSANFAKVIDNLNRTDYLLARNILAMVQEFYTEQRLLHITSDRLTNQVEALTINQVTPEGQIANDLTIGEYEIVITNQPERDTFEDTQFEQAIRLKTEAGVAIPDQFIVESSRLKDKARIVQTITGESDTPEAKAAKALQFRKAQAEVVEIEAKGMSGMAKAKLDAAKAQKETNEAKAGHDETTLELIKMNREHRLEIEKMEHEFMLEEARLKMELRLKQQESAAKIQMQQEQMRRDSLMARAKAVTKSATNKGLNS